MPQFSIKHLFALTAICGAATSLLHSYIAVYGARPVAESLVAGLALVIHCIFLFATTYGTWLQRRISARFAIAALMTELLGFGYIFGRFGLTGFVVSMTILLVVSFTAGGCCQLFGPSDIALRHEDAS